jgi:hypothetical protein
MLHLKRLAKRRRQDSQTFGGLRPALRARLPARGLPPHPVFAGAVGICAPGTPTETPRPIGTRRQARNPNAGAIGELLSEGDVSRASPQAACLSGAKDRARTGAEPNP